LRSTVVLPLLLALAMVSPGCGPRDRPDGAAGEAELFAADRAFAAATAERGLDGWMDWFSEDAARVELHGALVRGLDAIREHDRELLDDPDLRLEWDPTDAGLFAGGLHGFTRGRYEVVRGSATAREILSSGAYLSFWRRDSQGWRVILDTGSPDPPRTRQQPAGESE